MNSKDYVLSVRIKNDKEGPQTGDVVLNGSAINEWLPGNEYEIGDVVVYKGQFYQSLENQKSETSFNYNLWEQVGIPDIIVPEFETETHYSEGQIIVYEGKLYRAKEDFLSSVKFYLENWDSISGETYSFTSEDKTVEITINDSTVDLSVSSYVDSFKKSLQNEIGNKVDKEAGKGLSTNDYTTTEKTKLLNILEILSIGDNLTLDTNGKLSAGFSVSFDASLDKNSTNGVQNKVIAEAVEDLQDEVDNVDGRVTTNANNIATNTLGISQNKTDIAQLQQDVNNTNILLHSKVDKVAGKDLSSNDYTDDDQTKLNLLPPITGLGANLLLTNGVLSAVDQAVKLANSTGQSTDDGMTQKAITDALESVNTSIRGDLANVATTGDFDDLMNKPSGETLTIQRNGTTVGTFITLSGSDETIDITVPETAADLGALSSSTPIASDIEMLLDDTTNTLTSQLKDQSGADLGSKQSIGLLDYLKDKLLDLCYPVGTIYESTKNVSPATFLGGTWNTFGAGRVLVGVDASDTDFNAAEKTGGEKTHKLTTPELPKHNHDITYNDLRLTHDTTSDVVSQLGPGSPPAPQTANTTDTGSNTPHNNLQPYTTVYRWVRTA